MAVPAASMAEARPGAGRHIPCVALLRKRPAAQHPGPPELRFPSIAFPATGLWPETLRGNKLLPVFLEVDAV
jgi:hypothetical protein